MSEQEQFMRNLRDAVSAVGNVTGQIQTLQRVAMARGYDQWQDAELAATGYTRNDLLALLYFADDVRAFLSGGTVQPASRQPTIDRYRSDL